MRLVLVSLVVHGLLLLSIFDIYFRSPVEHGMSPQYPTHGPPPAKRLVLFVADGLRADAFYSVDGSGKTLAPYLRSIVETRGVWGVSHTRVPTESRPGHVAVIAGLYEDVSAVTRGWQENPVEFDMYESEAADFADDDASRLDSWVFSHVEHFFHNTSMEDVALAKALQEDGTIFFLHLLGIDTNGHAHKSASDEYQENIKPVEEGIERMEQLIEDYFHDGQTAYIFTADHGMTDWGSRGAGLPEETMTPLLAWGAGLRGAQQVAPVEACLCKETRCIIRCVDVSTAKVKRLQEQDEGASSSEARKTLKKELTALRLMQSEQTVEAVVRERSLKVFKERCWQAYQPPDL